VRTLVLILILASACANGRDASVREGELEASAPNPADATPEPPSDGAWDRDWQFANLPLAPRFTHFRPFADLTDPHLLPAFADPGAVVSIDVEWWVPHGGPVHIVDKARIRRILASLRARPVTKGAPQGLMGFANARITVRFATGEQASYVVSERSWQGDPDPTRPGADGMRGEIVRSWADLRADLGRPR